MEPSRVRCLRTLWGIPQLRQFWRTGELSTGLPASRHDVIAAWPEAPETPIAWRTQDACKGKLPEPATTGAVANRHRWFMMTRSPLLWAISRVNFVDPIGIPLPQKGIITRGQTAESTTKPTTIVSSSSLLQNHHPLIPSTWVMSFVQNFESQNANHFDP